MCRQDDKAAGPSGQVSLPGGEDCETVLHRSTNPDSLRTAQDGGAGRGSGERVLPSAAAGAPRGAPETPRGDPGTASGHVGGRRVRGGDPAWPGLRVPS